MKSNIVVYFIFCLLIASCTSSTSDVSVSQDARFTNYVTGFTSGIISKKDNITVRFASAVDLPDNPAEGLFTLSPAVKGTLIKSGQSLVLHPKRHSGPAPNMASPWI